MEHSSNLTFIDEHEVNSFPNGTSEFIAIPAFRVPAMLLTPTCRLSEDYWLFSPLIDLKDNPQIKRETLFSTSRGYSEAFGVYAIPNSKTDISFVNFHYTVSVPSQPFRKLSEAKRLASLSKEAQVFLADKVARFLGAAWGFSHNEAIEQEGYYRCRICARHYGLEQKTVYLRKGEHPPECPNCKAIRTSDSWELLLKHKKSRKLVDAEIPVAPKLEQQNRLRRFIRKVFKYKTK